MTNNFNDREWRNRSQDGLEFSDNPSNFAKVKSGDHGLIRLDEDGSIHIDKRAYADDVVAFVLACIKNHPGIACNIKQKLGDFLNGMDERALKIHGYSKSPEQQAYIWKQIDLLRADSAMVTGGEKPDLIIGDGKRTLIHLTHSITANNHHKLIVDYLMVDGYYPSTRVIYYDSIRLFHYSKGESSYRMRVQFNPVTESCQLELVFDDLTKEDCMKLAKYIAHLSENDTFK
jgi:hypothetical protein